MITAGGTAGDFGLAKHSVFSTLTRVGPNFNTLVRFLVEVLQYYKWNKLSLIYDPYGQKEISSKYCHIAANDIHYGLRAHAHTKNFTQDYKKFENPNEILSDLPKFIGLQSAGKSLINHYRGAFHEAT